MKLDINKIELDQENIYNHNVLHETLRQLEYYTVLEYISKNSFSELGKEIILKSLPIDDIEFLNREHDLIEEMITIISKDLTPSLDGLSDIRQKLYKSMIENAILNPTEILNVLDTIRIYRYVRNAYSNKEEQFPRLYELTYELYDNRILEKHITDAIDDNGEVKDTATRELHRIRTDIKVKSAKLRDRLQKILRKVSEEDLVRDDFYSIREGRFVLPVKVENKRVLPGIIHGVSNTGATVFIEPSEIIELNNELSLLQNDEQREIYKILANLTNEIGSEANRFLHSLSIIAHYDSLFGKANYALSVGGIKPQIHNDNYIILKDIRHPLLVHSKGYKKVVPLSIEFNNETRGHLISGPNAGGKTVALKSVGINILLALSGIFPIGTCHTNFRTVFTSIGDQQSIENDLSTFSSQILRIKNILDNCNQNSLILADEIGSGTDPQEGSALASSIIDSFLRINLFFIATTHQSSLKTYALNKSEIQNASLEFDSNKLQPTYKFQNGIPGNSYAFVLAQNIGISNHIINKAKKYLGNRHNELENSIKLLQQYKQEAENNLLQLAQEKLKFEKKNSELDHKLSELKIKRTDMLNNAKLEAEKIISDANSLVERTIKDIKEAQKPISEIKQEFTQEKNKIEKETSKIKKIDPDNPNPPNTLVSGETVVLVGTNSKGIILEANDTQKTALVEFNGMKIRLPYHEIRPSKPDKTNITHTQYIKYDINQRIDVRGLRADETIKQIDDFLQNAIVNNLDNFTILHGKGTGALREAIHKYLKENEYIQTFRIGDLVEGGAGVTIVELK